MLRRTFSADFINSVLMDESVSEGAEILGTADISQIASNPENVVLVNEYGGFIIIKKMPGVYEYHTQFLPDGRGKKAFKAAHESLLYMFTKTDCERVITRVNVNNPSVQRFTEKFMGLEGTNQGYHYYQLNIDSWIKVSQQCLNRGHKFHETVQEHTNHGEDSIHDHYVGAACLMAEAGNFNKAQYFYNRWAVMSGYEPIYIISEMPTVLKIGDMILNERLEPCQ